MVAIIPAETERLSLLSSTVVLYQWFWCWLWQKCLTALAAAKCLIWLLENRLD